MYFPLTIRLLPLLSAVVLATASLPLRAQEQEPPAQPVAKAAGTQDPEAALLERVDKAIAAYEEVHKDAKKLAQRRRLLGWLGEIDHARVTEYLEEDLKRNRKAVSGAYTIEAIAKVARPDLKPVLLDAIKAPDSSQEVRAASTRLLIEWDDRLSDELLDLVSEDKNVSVRHGLLLGLSRSESPRAQRGLAKLMLAGEHEHRLAMLLATQSATGIDVIDAARIKCVKEGNLQVSATAWRLLAEQGHRRAKDLIVDVLERVQDKPDPLSAAELIQGLVLVGDPDFFPAILRFGAVPGAGVKAALRKVVDAAGQNSKLLAFLLEEGLESEGPGERTVAKILLSKAPPEAIAPLVERVRNELRRNRKNVLDSAAGLHELLAKDPTWVQDLAGLARASDLESRMLGLAMLLEMESPAAIEAAQSYLKHRAWELRSLSYRYLTKCRDVTSIPFLIARYGKEEGRLEAELDTALFVHTGTKCWKAQDWTKWWRANQVGFVLPHADSITGGGSTSGGKTVSYYDIPLVSSRIAFIVDHSGSMSARVGTDKKRNRLMAAQEQLRAVIAALPKTHKVNLIPFHTTVARVWRELKTLNTENRAELLDEVEKIKLAGGTNTFGALMAAMEDPEVDTIYLLTDGVPTAGELTDTEDILDAVMRENRIRQIVIHCISIGMKSQLLMDLAAMTGGQYKYVQ